MAASAVAVLFVEMLTSRPGAARVAPGSWRRAAVPVAVTAALLLASAIPLTSHRVHEGDGWDTGAPWSYTGPLSLVEQKFRANQDNLGRIDIWAEMDGTPGSAEIFARLTPAGSDSPIRESRAVVHGTRFSIDTVTFKFEPIPSSSGKVYTLAIGVLSGPSCVFLGLTGGDEIPDRAVSVNGKPTPYTKDLPMRTT